MLINGLDWFLKTSVPSPDLSFQPDEHLEVYVSASENPNHFWIQILGVRSLQLDKLIEEMTNFYSDENSTVRTSGAAVVIMLLHMGLGLGVLILAR